MSIIKLVDLHKSYYLATWEEIPVLNGIDMEVNQNEFIALMWESGSWKSTLLNIIWCLHPLTSWNYFLDWDDISNLKDDYALSYIRNKKMWFIFQQFYLLPRLNCIENVALPWIFAWISVHNRETKSIELLKRLWLGEKLYSKPWELSWGQQQRVAIARALINDPEIILADEPTWNLDSQTTSEIIKLILELVDSWKTIVMVTHTPEVAKFAHRIVYLKDWKILDNNYKLKV